MNKSKSILALFMASGLVTSAEAADDNRVTLKFSAQTERSQSKNSEISVEGNGSRYDRVSSANLSLSLHLAGSLTAGAANHRILGSEVVLKGEADAAKIDVLKGYAPASTVDLNQTFDFSVAVKGAVAQNAISRCNGVPAAERGSGKSVSLTLSVPLVWRVTTGRFNFKWTNYDRVAPSQEIYNNRDFYADQESTEAEASADVTVNCQPIAVASAVVDKAAPAKPVAAAPAATAPAAVVAKTSDSNVVDAKPAVTETKLTSNEAKPAPQPDPAKSSTPAPMTTASLTSNGKPQCDGGMLRQLNSGEENYLCLCPGNTVRVETGDNAYACEKKSRH